MTTIGEIHKRLAFGQPLSRLNVEQNIAVPYGAEKSKLLNEEMILRIVDVLPARAQGYNWILVSFRDCYKLIF